MQSSGRDLHKGGRLEEELKMRWQMMQEGTEQEVNVVNNTMFNKLMTAIGAKWSGNLEKIENGEALVKMKIRVEVTMNGEKIELVADGEPFKSETEAETSAIASAVRKLEQQGVMKVVDFSSKTTLRLEAHNAYGSVTEGISHIGNLLEHLDKIVSNTSDLTLKLEGREVHERLIGNDGSDLMVYSTLNNTLSGIVKRFSHKSSKARSKMNDIEFQRQKHRTRVTETGHSASMRGNLRKVFLTSRNILDHVVPYLGFKKTKYSNGPDGRGEANAEVKFSVPYMKRVKYTGNIAIPGQGKNSLSSEEDAAYQALLFIEVNYSIKIVDFNHQQRVQAEKEQELLVKLLREEVCLGSGVKNMMDDLIESIKSETAYANFYEHSALEDHMEEDRIDPYKYCAEALKNLETESTKYYNDCLPLFERMQKLAWELSALKIKLDME